MSFSLLNQYINIDDKDPVWMNKIIKSKIETKNKLYKQIYFEWKKETLYLLRT